MISRTSSIFNEVPLVLRRLSLHEFLESCHCAFKIVDTNFGQLGARGILRTKISPYHKPHKRPLKQMIIVIYLLTHYYFLNL